MSQDYLKNSVVKTVLFTLLKVVLFIILVALFFVAGLFIGYALIGDGNYWEVLNRDTWQHILDFIR